MTKTITIIVVITGVVTWASWTLYASLNRIEGDTISEFVRGLSLMAPVVALLFGAVAGHWFGMPFDDVPLVQFIRKYPGAAFAIGYIAGSLCWSMRG